MSVGLHIELEEIEHRIVLRLDGRLDAATTSVLERKLNTLIDEHHYRLILDMTHIDYLSSAGLRLLLFATKKLKEKKGDLILCSLQEEVSELIKMAGFNTIFHICLNETEALQYHK